MAELVTINDFATLLDERYRQVVEQRLASMVKVEDMIYKKTTMDRRTERKSSVGQYPLLQEFTGQLPYGRQYEQYNVEATARTYVAGLRITQDFLEDNLTDIFEGDVFAPMVDASIVTRNIHAASMFNFADSVDTTWYTRSEALPLASNAHTTRTPGVSTATGFDNLILDVLSPTSLRGARTQFRQFRNDQGQLIDMEPNELWVTSDNDARADELLLSKQYPDDARNAINPEAGRQTKKVLIHWNSTENWALMNTQARLANCEWLDRIPLDYFKIKEFDTFQAKWALRGRWTNRVFHWNFALWSLVD